MTDRDRLIKWGNDLHRALFAARTIEDKRILSHEQWDDAMAALGGYQSALQDCERERERLFTETEGPAGLREQAADLRLEIKFREAAEQRVEELERVLSQIAGGFISPSKGERRLRDVAKAALAASPPPEEQDG